MRKSVILRFILGVISTILLLGCALPDLKPFADSTSALHTAVLKTNASMQLTLTKAGAQSAGDRFAKEMAVRVAAMKAVVSYTDSLAHIADAGRLGTRNAGQVANALDGFLDSLSVDPLPTKYVVIAKSLYGLVAQVRAAQSFSKAVERADPAIQSIAKILIADFDEVEKLLAQARVPVRTELSQKGNNKALVDYRNSLERRRRELEGAVSADLTNSAKVSELKEINRLIDLTRDRYEPLMAELKSIDDRTELQICLVRKARDGIKQWAEIHSGLAASVKNGLSPNTRLLLATVIEIREFIKEENAK